MDDDQQELKEDRLKLELERLRHTVSHAIDVDDSSDDEDILHVSYDDDLDENGANHSAVDIKPLPMYYGESASIQAMSQDSLASISALESEFSTNPEVCLAMNRTYQLMVNESLENIALVLEQNRKRQDEVCHELQEQATEKTVLAKKKTLAVYAKPYFKDIHGSFPPLNDETVSRRHAQLLDPFVKPPKNWSADERSKLRNAVQADRLKKVLRPLMNKKEIEHAKKQKVLPNSAEEIQIQERLDNLDKQIREIRLKTDVLDIYGEVDDAASVDWLKIANIDFEGQRDPQSCMVFWKNAAHPAIDTSKWSPEEDNALLELVVKYEGVQWQDIARDLKTNRTAFQCLQRYQTKLNPCLLTGKWSTEEDNFLKEVVANCRVGDSIPWSYVAYYVEGRSREQCAQRWQQLFPISIGRGRWSEDEDRKLTDAVVRFGTSNWWKIQEFVPRRTAPQCRERWANSLNEAVSFGNWTYDEDKALWLAVEELGPGKWQYIAKERIKTRTDNMCLQRYRRLCRWKTECEFLASMPSKYKSAFTSQAWNRLRRKAARDVENKAKQERVAKLAEKETRFRRVECALLNVENGFGPSTVSAAAVPDVTPTTSTAAPICHKREPAEDADNATAAVPTDDNERVNGNTEALGNTELNNSDTDINDSMQTDEPTDDYTEEDERRLLALRRYRNDPELYQKGLAELEAIRRDRELGIEIPRPPVSVHGTRCCSDALRHRALLRNLVASQLSSEKKVPSNYNAKLEQLLEGNIDPQLRETVTKVLSEGTEPRKRRGVAPVKYEDDENDVIPRPQSAVPGGGRPRQSEEEMEVESEIIALLQSRMSRSATKGRKRTCDGSDGELGFSPKRSSATADEAASQEARTKVMRLMTTALNFHKYVVVPPSASGHAVSASDSGTQLAVAAAAAATAAAAANRPTPAPTAGTQSSVLPSNSSSRSDSPAVSRPASNGVANSSQQSTDDIVINPSESVVLVVKTVKREPNSEFSQQPSAASTPVRQPQPTPPIAIPSKQPPPQTTVPASGNVLPHSTERTTSKRPALTGAQANKVYHTPPLPPTVSTVSAFQAMLLDRVRLLRIAGKFYAGGILGVPPEIAEEVNRGVSTSTDTNSTGRYVEATSSETTVTSLRLSKSGVVTMQATPGRRGRKKTKGTGFKWCPQVVRSKPQADALIHSIRGTHDYQMLHARFSSLFLWPALLSTVPIHRQPIGVDVGDGNAAAEARMKTVASLLGDGILDQPPEQFVESDAEPVPRVRHKRFLPMHLSKIKQSKPRGCTTSKGFTRAKIAAKEPNCKKYKRRDWSTVERRTSSRLSAKFPNGFPTNYYDDEEKVYAPYERKRRSSVRKPTETSGSETERLEMSFDGQEAESGNEGPRAKEDEQKVRDSSTDPTPESEQPFISPRVTYPTRSRELDSSTSFQNGGKSGGESDSACRTPTTPRRGRGRPKKQQGTEPVVSAIESACVASVSQTSSEATDVFVETAEDLIAHCVQQPLVGTSESHVSVKQSLSGLLDGTGGHSVISSCSEVSCASSVPEMTVVRRARGRPKGPSQVNSVLPNLSICTLKLSAVAAELAGMESVDTADEEISTADARIAPEKDGDGGRVSFKLESPVESSSAAWQFGTEGHVLEVPGHREEELEEKLLNGQKKDEPSQEDLGESTSVEWSGHVQPGEDRLTAEEQATRDAPVEEETKPSAMLQSEFDDDRFEDADENFAQSPMLIDDEQFADADEDEVEMEMEDSKTWNQTITVHDPRQPSMTLVLSPPVMPTGYVPQPAGVLVLPLFKTTGTPAVGTSADQAAAGVGEAEPSMPLMLTVEPQALHNMFHQMPWSIGANATTGSVSSSWTVGTNVTAGSLSGSFTSSSRTSHEGMLRASPADHNLTKMLSLSGAMQPIGLDGRVVTVMSTPQARDDKKQ